MDSLLHLVEFNIQLHFETYSENIENESDSRNLTCMTMKEKEVCCDWGRMRIVRIVGW